MCITHAQDDGIKRHSPLLTKGHPPRRHPGNGRQVLLQNCLSLRQISIGVTHPHFKGLRILKSFKNKNKRQTLG